MTRDPLSVTIADVSVFARTLRREVGDDAGHQIWLNRIARAAGFRNFQHLSATRKGAEPPADSQKVARARRYFDDAGRMASWPAKTAVQHLCLWVIWAGMPAGQALSEREVSDRIDQLTGFQDAAIVRRTLIELGLFSRTRDGAVYQRVEQRPHPEARALIRALRESVESES